jgi:hypothetical protein
MKRILMVVSVAGLALVIAPPVLYFAASMEKGTMQTLMLAGTLLWFGSVPLWMGRQAR